MSAKVGSAIGRSLTTVALEHVRRASPVDAMLMGTVLLWALNVTVTKYMFEHGWRPLAYGTIRYFAAIVALLGLHLLARALVPHRPGRRASSCSSRR